MFSERIRADLDSDVLMTADATLARHGWRLVSEAAQSNVLAGSPP